MTGFRLLASDVTNLGSVVTRTVRPGLVVGLAPGRGTGAFPKVAPNEDSLGVEELEEQFSGLDPAAIARMLQGDDLESGLRALLAASRGDDNLAAIAVREAS